MPTFAYKARTQSGQVVEGTLSAESQAAALRQLDERSLLPVVIRERRAGESVLPVPGRGRRLSGAALATLYSQLSDLLRAGVPVLRALDVMARQSRNPVQREILQEVREDVAAGEALADAMAKHPRAFRELHVAMVRAGERGGFLEDVLARIAAFTQRQNELQSKLVGSLIYPAILVLLGSGVVVFLMTFVVPKIRPFLEGRPEGLPIMTRIVFGVCDGLRHYGLLGLIGVIVGVLVVMPYFRTPQGRRQLDLLKLRIPLAGAIFRMLAVSRFCRILGTMLQNGVPILQALRISRDSAGNAVLAEAIDEAAESVRKGETLAAPLAASGLFPLDIVSMIAVAEESNNLESVLVQIAETNENRTARLIDVGVRLLEPILLVVMAMLVLVIALALLLPILTISKGLG